MGERLADIRWRSRQIPQPAAGAELTFTCPGEVNLLVVSLAFSMTTDATVANRATSLVLDVEGFTVFQSVAGVVLAASLTQKIGAFAGATRNGSAGGNTLIGLPIPGLVMRPGWVLRTQTDNLAVGDQYTAAGFLMVEYETGPFASAVPMPPFYVEQLDPAYVS